MASHYINPAKKNTSLQLTNHPYVPAMAEQGPVGNETQQHESPGTYGTDLSQRNGHCYTLTRQGLAPCEGFNAGTCFRTGKGNRCVTNPAEVHQCNLCLRTGHGAKTCGLAKKGGKGAGRGGGLQGTYQNNGGKGGKNKGKNKGAKPWQKKW